MLSKFCIHYASKSGRPSSCHRTGKGQTSSQFPRRVVLKTVLIISQLHSSPVLVRSCLKSYMLGFSIMWTKNFWMSKLGLEKEEEPEIKLPTFAVPWRKQRNSRKTLLLLYWLHWSLWLCGSQQTVENSSRDGNTRPPYPSPVNSVCRSRSSS